MKKTVRHKIRKDCEKFVCDLLSNMNLRERILFVIKGKYNKALERTENRLDREGKL